MTAPLPLNARWTPWRYEDGKVFGRDRGRIAYLSGTLSDPAAVDVAGHAMAAALEMYNALLHARQVIVAACNAPGFAIIEIDAALAKARGEG